MKKVKRLWFKALESGVDDRLVKLLCKLNVVKDESWLHYQQISHISLIQYRYAKDKKSLKQAARNDSTPNIPKRIKPTKTR